MKCSTGTNDCEYKNATEITCTTEMDCPEHYNCPLENNAKIGKCKKISNVAAMAIGLLICCLVTICLASIGGCIYCCWYKSESAARKQRREDRAQR
jgi:hypothetical protein